MIKVLHEKCDPKLADNKKLPYTAYLIEYVEEDKTFYDMTTLSTNNYEQVDIDPDPTRNEKKPVVKVV